MERTRGEWEGALPLLRQIGEWRRVLCVHRPSCGTPVPYRLAPVPGSPTYTSEALEPLARVQSPLRRKHVRNTTPRAASPKHVRNVQLSPPPAPGRACRSHSHPTPCCCSPFPGALPPRPAQALHQPASMGLGLIHPALPHHVPPLVPRRSHDAVRRPAQLPTATGAVHAAGRRAARGPAAGGPSTGTRRWQSHIDSTACGGGRHLLAEWWGRATATAGGLSRGCPRSGGRHREPTRARVWGGNRHRCGGRGATLSSSSTASWDEGLSLWAAIVQPGAYPWGRGRRTVGRPAHTGVRQLWEQPQQQRGMV